MKERIAGLGFLVIAAALLGLCVASYAKVFSPGVAVVVAADSAGLQLHKGADVKLHGVLVGEVRDVGSTGHGADLSLALDTASRSQIPQGVTARLLPKTLFGEKYVELIPPKSKADGQIAADTVIKVDKSKEAVELGDVLDGALPLLRAVPPEKLAVTLTSLSKALDGRGDELGDTFVKLGDVVRDLNDEMPTIQADIDELATVLDTYHGALPDLMKVLENLTTTSDTITDQGDQLKSLWMSTEDFSDDTRAFLDRYQGRLIQFGEVSEPVLKLLATYSPEYPCIFQGLTTLQPNVEDAFSGGRLHITLEITKDNGKYKSGDEPEWLSDYGPDCRGLPDPDTPGPQREYDNGYEYDSSRVNLPLNIPGLTDSKSSDKTTDPDAAKSDDEKSDSDEESTLPFDPRMGYAGTSEEQDVINPLVAASTGASADDVPKWAPLVWGPLMRGNKVSAY